MEPVEDAVEETYELAYGDNADFNEYLDELNPMEGKLLYSEALFHLYLEDYEIQLGSYRDMMEELLELDLDIEL